MLDCVILCEEGSPEEVRTEVGVCAKEHQMKTGKRLFHWQKDEIRGQPVQTWGYECIPIGQVLQVKWPGGGVVWHRPLAVEVRQNGQSTRLPISDVTRRLQISLDRKSTRLNSSHVE